MWGAGSNCYCLFFTSPSEWNGKNNLPMCAFFWNTQGIKRILDYIFQKYSIKIDSAIRISKCITKFIKLTNMNSSRDTPQIDLLLMKLLSKII